MSDLCVPALPCPCFKTFTRRLRAQSAVQHSCVAVELVSYQSLQEPQHWDAEHKPALALQMLPCPCAGVAEGSCTFASGVAKRTLDGLDARAALASPDAWCPCSATAQHSREAASQQGKVKSVAFCLRSALSLIHAKAHYSQELLFSAQTLALLCETLIGMQQRTHCR